MIRDNREWNLGTRLIHVVKVNIFGHCSTLAVKVMVCIRKLQQRINYTTNFHHSSVCANCFNLHYVNFTTLAIQQGVEEWPSMKSPYTFILHKIYFKGGQLVRSKVSGGGVTMYFEVKCPGGNILWGHFTS